MIMPNKLSHPTHDVDKEIKLKYYHELIRNHEVTCLQEKRRGPILECAGKTENHCMWRIEVKTKVKVVGTK